MIYFEKLIKKAGNIENPLQKVLAIGGSTRKGGNTDIILKQIVAGLTTEQIEIIGTLPVFKAFEKGAVKKQKDIIDKAFELGLKLGQSLKE